MSEKLEEKLEKTELLKTKEDHQSLMMMMSSITQQICLLPLEEYIRKSDLADTIAPFLDPTLWIKSHKNATDWNELAKDLNKIKQKYKEMVFHGKG
jgi:hypothetical protein